MTHDELLAELREQIAQEIEVRIINPSDNYGSITAFNLGITEAAKIARGK